MKWLKRLYWKHMIAEIEHQMMFFEIRFADYQKRIAKYEKKLEELKPPHHD